MHEEMLTYGLKDGTTNELIFIDDAHNGKDCGCVCPHCGEDLEACQGDIQQHHFRHVSGKKCSGARMTELHILAQQILAQEKTVKLPSFIGHYRQKYVAADKITFDKVILEEPCKDEEKRLVPDCIGYKDDTGFNLWVEIFCCHKLDPEKIEEIKRREQNCIEIDFSDLLDNPISEDIVKVRLLDDRYIKWICCPDWEKEDLELQKEFEEQQRLEAQRQQEYKLEFEEQLRLERQRQEVHELETQRLQNLVDRWFQNPNAENTDEIIREMDEKKDVDTSLFEIIVKKTGWIKAVEKFPRNEFGLRVFYNLLKYFYRVHYYGSMSDATKDWRLALWASVEQDYTKAPKEKQVLHEYWMVLWVLSEMEIYDERGKYANKFIENSSIREEVIRIMLEGKSLDCFNEDDVRKKVKHYYKDKIYGEDILQIFEFCFPASPVKNTKRSKYADAFSLSKENSTSSLEITFA